MDLGFAARSKARAAAGTARAPVDHRALLAAFAAIQAACPGTIAAARLQVASAPADARAALVALLTPDADWPVAAASLGGSFAPGAASALAGKARSTLMKAHFTFAF